MKNTSVGQTCVVLAAIILIAFVAIGLYAGSYTHTIDYLPQSAENWKVVLPLWAYGIGFASVTFALGEISRIMFSIYRIHRRNLELTDPDFLKANQPTASI